MCTFSNTYVYNSLTELLRAKADEVSKMPPNIVESPTDPNGLDDDPSKSTAGIRSRALFSNSNVEDNNAYTQLSNNQTESVPLKTFMYTLNTFCHAMIGIVVALSFIFSINNDKPLAKTPLHIILCVIGYQLLMAEAILSLSSSNVWSSQLRLVDKRRAHWILQICGSGLAIAGSFIKIIDKSDRGFTHFNTTHGIFALIALVFTTVSLVNGLASLYAAQLKFIPPLLSKLTHICFGTVAFAASCIALCYGFDKASFRNWIHEGVAYTAIAATAAIGFIVITSPAVSFFQKTRSAFRR